MTTLGQGAGKSITASATDAAGNASTSVVKTFAIDTIAPSTPTINAIAGDNIINLSEATGGVALSGTAEAASTVKVTIGSLTKTVTTATNG